MKEFNEPRPFFSNTRLGQEFVKADKRAASPPRKPERRSQGK
jgi:hypothetical protein